MNKTKIEYLDYTWNPLAMRCAPVSEGCEHCWHLRMADRFSKNPMLSGEVQDAYAGSRPPVLRGKELEGPLKLKKPSIIGVQFMGDLFYSEIEPLNRYMILRIMAQAKQHQFLILTKRLEEMNFHLQILYDKYRLWEIDSGPLKNVWLGVTVENQQRADERIPILLQIPAAVHFLSIEPMLGHMDLKSYLPDPLDGAAHIPNVGDFKPLDWVIVGGETGPGARPAKAEWFLSLIDQCKMAGIPIFIKKAPEGVPIIREFPKRED